MSFCSFGPVDSLDFSILLSWGCSFFSLQFGWGKKGGGGGFRILRIKVIVRGYLQPAACIKWRLEEHTLEVQGKCRGAGIWELHSCEPKGKAWGFMANFFWCHVISKPTSEKHHKYQKSSTSNCQGQTYLGIVEGLGVFASLKSSSEVKLNFGAWWTYVLLKNWFAGAHKRWWAFCYNSLNSWKPTLEVKTPRVMKFWRTLGRKWGCRGGAQKK